MATEAPEPSVTAAGELYALVSYLHAAANQDLLEAIALEQLSFSQLMLLERLRGGRQPTIRQAAALMHTSCAGASRIIDGLARRGLINREVDERDFRAKRARITERGTAVITRLHAARLGPICAFVEGLRPGDGAELQAAVHRIIEHHELAGYRPAPMPA